MSTGLNRCEWKSYVHPCVHSRHCCIIVTSGHLMIFSCVRQPWAHCKILQHMHSSERQSFPHITLPLARQTMLETIKCCLPVSPQLLPWDHIPGEPTGKLSTSLPTVWNSQSPGLGNSQLLRSRSATRTATLTRSGRFDNHELWHV